MIADEAQARAWVAELPQADDAAMQRLERLATLLADENTQQNLVSATSLDAVWQRHIADSAQLLLHVPRETLGGAWLDLGTGAGFPGLVIACLLPEIQISLVESRKRRSDWLEQTRESLGLTQARVVTTRLELLPTSPYCVISARAFAPLGKLLELSARFSTTATTWLLPKGRSARHELAELAGWHHAFHVE
ncbi:MAG: 16S rRNA (guanine(527)-N(7))-methyltransferase RsmG, partial [Novosphingobium sp.]